MKFVSIVFLVIVIIIYRYRYSVNEKHNLTLNEINLIVTEGLNTTTELKYDHIFKNETIPKTIHTTDTFSESVFKQMNIRDDPSSFLKVHTFLKKSENLDFIMSHKSRFNIPSFQMLATSIILPSFTDVIIKQMTHYSEYISLGSVFTFYNSGMRVVDKEIHEIFDAFHLILNFANKPVKIKCHIAFTDVKKRAYPGEIVGLAKNINSGMTFGKTIIIWRIEEVVKVFIHEMVHLLNLDIGNAGNNILTKLVHSMKIELNDSISSLGEAYTETVAKIIYSIHKSGKNESNFHVELDKEIEWSLHQCTRVLALNGINRIGEDKKVIKQYTYMFEYYILHSFFMYDIRISKDISKYINFFKQNNNKLPASELSEQLSLLNVTKFVEEINLRLDDVPSNSGHTCRNLNMASP